MFNSGKTQAFNIILLWPMKNNNNSKKKSNQPVFSQLKSTIQLVLKWGFDWVETLFVSK